METKGKMKIDKIDNDWASSSLTKKEKILLVVYVFAPLSILFFTAWLLRSMAPSIMKAVLIFIPLWIVMLIEVIISPFGGVKQNEN
jgi:quinol-cytochrome oxidoreductase complex cytochrome b subunit